MHKFVHMHASPSVALASQDLVLEIVRPECGRRPTYRPGLLVVTSLLDAADALVAFGNRIRIVICDDEVSGPIDAFTFLTRVREAHPDVSTELRLTPRRE
jgi:hypothetical protein